MSDPNQKPVTQPDRGPQRIKLAHIFARGGSIDFPGGQNQISNMEMGRDKDDPDGVRRHYLAWYVPSEAVITVEFHPGGKAQPQTMDFPIDQFRSWVRNEHRSSLPDSKKLWP